MRSILIVLAAVLAAVWLCAPTDAAPPTIQPGAPPCANALICPVGPRFAAPGPRLAPPIAVVAPPVRAQIIHRHPVRNIFWGGVRVAGRIVYRAAHPFCTAHALR